MKSIRNCVRGGALVETAVLLPVLIIMMVGIVQVGAMVNVKLVVSEAAREAAREYATYALSETSLCEYGWQRALEKAESIVGNGFDSDLFLLDSRGSYVSVKVSHRCPVFAPGVEQLVSKSSIWDGDSVLLSGNAVFYKELRGKSNKG